MKRSKTHIKAFLCNIVIVILCLLSISSYFSRPFWEVEVSWCINADALEYIADQIDIESESPDESEDETASSEDVFSFEDILQYVQTTEIPVKLSLTLKTPYILSAFQPNTRETVQQIIDDNVYSLVDQIYSPLNKAFETAATTASKIALKEGVKNQLKSIYGDEKTNSELEQILIDANIDVDGKVDSFIETIYAPDATVQSISTKIIDTIDGVIEELRVYDEEKFADLEFSEENKTEVRNGIEEALSPIAAEDGSIDMENFIADMLLQYFESEEESEETQAMSLRISETAKQSATQNKNSKEELKSKFCQLIAENIPDEAVETIVVIMQGIACFILFTFFTWAYLILKIILKSGRKNPTIKLKLPIWLGWLPYLILGILPTAAISMLRDPASLSFLGAEAVEGITYAMEALNAFSFDISFYSCADTSFIIAILLCLFVIFYYGRLRKRIKQLIRGKIVEDEDGGYVSASEYYKNQESQVANDNDDDKDAPRYQITEETGKDFYRATFIRM